MGHERRMRSDSRLRSWQFGANGFERLEPRELLAADSFELAADPARLHRLRVDELIDRINWETSHVNASFFDSDLVVRPTVVGGSEIGDPNDPNDDDRPALAVDSNTPAGGDFGGVVSIQIFIPDFPDPRPGHEGQFITAQFICSGSVISPTHVLSAAHCFDELDLDGQADPNISAVVNLNDGLPASGSSFSATRNVSSIMIHPDFDGFSESLNDDVAVLELDTPVPVGTPIYSVPGQADKINPAMPPGQRVNLVGYGVSGFGDPTAYQLGPINRGIAVSDNATGAGYILYSEEDLFSRFSANPPFSNNSDHLIAVRYAGGNWEYNDNNNWHVFTPAVTDRLLAEVDFSADTITSLQGVGGQVNGIDQGFGTSDMTFQADFWNGASNDGEFTVSGNDFRLGFMIDPALDIKRQRQNIADSFIKDDEGEVIVFQGQEFFIPDGPDEIFLIDFDSSELPLTAGDFGGVTLGNNVEGSFGPGDSGGPAFAMDGNGVLQTDGSGKLIVAGINTFNEALGGVFGPKGFFGDVSGGIMTGAYADWINSIIGFPSSPLVDLQLSTDVSVAAGTGGMTEVTYELSVTNAGPNDATGVTIANTLFDLPAGVTVTIPGAFTYPTWNIGSLAASATETLTFVIEFDPTTMTAGDPFDIGFEVDSVVEPDTDDTNDSVSETVSLEVPFAAEISGSTWAIDSVPLNFGANGTLSFDNLDAFSITFAGPLSAAPVAQVYGPTDGAPQIPATAGVPNGTTVEYTVPNLTQGFYKIVVAGSEIDFSIKPGDADGTQDVNILDFGAFATYYNPDVFLGTTPVPGDFNGTGTVDIFDFGVFATYYLTDLSGFTPPSVAPPPPPPAYAAAALADAVWASVVVGDESDDEHDRRRGRSSRFV